MGTRFLSRGPAVQGEGPQRGDLQRRPAAVARGKMERAERMNRVGAFEAALMRMPRICALLLVCLAVPAHLAAQTEADRESVNEGMESLLAKGDSREVEIPAGAGEEYEVAGTTESPGADIDICIYGPTGDQVVVVLIVSFTSKTEGIDRQYDYSPPSPAEGWDSASLKLDLGNPEMPDPVFDALLEGGSRSVARSQWRDIPPSPCCGLDRRNRHHRSAVVTLPILLREEPRPRTPGKGAFQ